MPADQRVDVQQIIDSNPLSAVQKTVIGLCFLVVAIDGFDTAAIGFIAPALRGLWKLTPTQLAPLFGAGLFGLMVGAFLFGPLGDKWGRKPVLALATLAFALCTLASAFAPDIETLTALRFATGLGLGGAMPAAITLTSEFSPAARRSTLVTLMFCGFTVGSACAGLAASKVVAAYGWQGLLVLGAALPLLLLPALLLLLPESPRYLALTGAATEKVAAIMRRVAPMAIRPGMSFTSQVKASGLPMVKLFQNGLAAGTLLLWLTFFMSLLVFYLLSSWLPLLITTAGFSMSDAALMAATLATGGTVGAVVFGWLMDRFEPHRVLAGAYVMAGVFVVLLGSATAAPVLLVGAIFGAGFGVAGAQVGVNALAASFYPTAARATGVSWANAVGRTGSVLGSMVGGFLLSLGWDLSTIFAIAALPCLIAALAMLAKGAARQPDAAITAAAE